MCNNKGLLRVPFDEKGLVNYPLPGKKGVYRWVDNCVFEDEIFIRTIGFVRSKFNAYFEAISLMTGQKYWIELIDFLELMHKTVLNRGKTAGRWTFIKRGNSYGIKYVN